MENFDELKNELQRVHEQLTIQQSKISATEKELRKIKEEKVKVVSQLKKQRHRNSNLKNQLSEEREFYLEQKQLYCKEMNECKAERIRRSKSMGDSPLQRKFSERELRSRLQSENSRLKIALKHKDHTIYNLCQKFLRMKRTKDHMLERLQTAEREYIQCTKNLMKYVDEARNEIDYLSGSRLKEPLGSKNALLLQVMKRNSFLIHENAELYLEVRRLRQKLEGNDIVTRQLSREVGLVEFAQDAAETGP
ncbi:cilia- and flagella-associated protein 45-like [Schistocerca gregaria]|uniref:cilia- and flagella-associated protein 45-like n=1 Tax=Schistocerca gregaria TaxID=7010 RepID=UPI00211DDC88|nr:cilia- and flagella-associated protein 45-like [Schistocerca gregaria]